MHLGTAIALFVFFWRDWLNFALSLAGASGAASAAGPADVFWLVVLATIPAVVVGSVLHKLLAEAFGAPAIAAAFLIVNGFLLYFGDLIAGEAVGTLDQLNWKGALAVGFAQCLALIPGISRSGSTIVAGVVAGLKHEEVGALLVPDGRADHSRRQRLRGAEAAEAGGDARPMAVLSGVVAGVVAYASLAFLMRYFHKHEFEALSPFAYYCWAAGASAWRSSLSSDA